MYNLIEKLNKLVQSHPSDTFIQVEFNQTVLDLIVDVESYGVKFVFTNLLKKQKRQNIIRCSDPIETLKIDARFKAESQVFAYLAEEVCGNG